LDKIYNPIWLDKTYNPGLGENLQPNSIRRKINANLVGKNMHQLGWKITLEKLRSSESDTSLCDSNNMIEILYEHVMDSTRVGI